MATRHRFYTLRLMSALIGAMALAMSAGVARAGDTALMEPIGYSDNLRYFAFEEFGVQDGSGFAYSSIYMIDLAQDRWVVGTPVRIIAETEQETLASVRDRVHEDASVRLVDLGIEVPAHLLVANGDGALDADASTLSFGLPAPGAPMEPDGRYQLQLEQFPAESGAPCTDWFGERAVGFMLKLTDYAPMRDVHRDGVLPRSRGCPVHYRIHSVYVPFGSHNIASAVALISVYAHGYEGLDRRFIAVALAKLQVGL